MIYGYCRISTKKQSIERQIRNIRELYPDAVIIEEVFTGKKIVRPNFEKLLKKLKKGDTVVFDSVSRMSRDAEEGVTTYMELYNKGLELVFLKEPQINTQTYKEAIEKKFAQSFHSGDDAADTLMNTIFDALQTYIGTLAERQIRLAFEQAEKEVKDLSQRTKEGIVTARLQGKKIGLEDRTGIKLTTQKSIKAKEEIKKYSKEFDGTLNDAEVMKLANISRNTYYKYKSELKAEQN